MDQVWEGKLAARLSSVVAIVIAVLVIGCTEDLEPDVTQEENSTSTRVDAGAATSEDASSETQGYGPLIIVDLPAIPDSEALLGEGSIVLTSDCAMLQTDSEVKLLVWEQATVAWLGTSFEVRFGDEVKRVADGDRVVLGGTAYVGGEEATFVQPPSSSCSGELSLVTSVTLIE